jgi:predicted alpha-1,2-mannosidase
MSIFKSTVLALIFLLFVGCSQDIKIDQLPTNDLLSYVDPFIGTGEHGHTFPGVVLPHGMVQLSPDTHLPGWDASSGYHYDDEIIYGFSHTHLSGTGIGDFGDILFLPFTGEILDTLIGEFEKKDELAEVGKYSVTLNNFNVKAALSATMRTGFHLYEYPESDDQKLLIDLGHILQANWGHSSLEGSLEFIDEYTLRGKRVSRGWAYFQPVYFYAKFSSPYVVDLIKDRSTVLEKANATGKEVKAWLSFPNNGEQKLEVKVGISFVDEKGAELNFNQEAAAVSFDDVVQEAKTKWSEELSRIEIQSSDSEVMTNFYTALYHSLIAPMLAQDVDGRYRGMDKEIHESRNGFVNYTVFSMWDTFRALHPLMTIIQRRKSEEWVKSLLMKYKQGGVLPKWALASNYTGTMVGYPAVSIIADALSKGIYANTTEALEASVASSIYRPDLFDRHEEPRIKQVTPKHLHFIEELGYIPADSVNGSVSYGQECAYYDWCIAKIAEMDNNQVVYNKYIERARNYIEYYDPKSGFMRGKMADGKWKEPFDPYYSDHVDNEYVEGNAWQWSWLALHDIQNLIRINGGKEKFAVKLDTLFNTTSEVKGENASADISGLIGQAAHGNEPSHHMAYFYNYVDQPHKAQEIIDHILYDFYLPEPAGIIGNEDCGAMSAWYIMNALGFYQFCPGDPIYDIGRPIVDGATINLENGSKFTLTVTNNSRENKYVQKIKINGNTMPGFRFPHTIFESDNAIEIVMGPKPQKK